MKKADKWIFLVVLFFALGFILLNSLNRTKYGNEKLYAEISVDGVLWDTIPLDGQEKEIVWSNGTDKNTILIHDDGVEIVEANCPDHVCEETGFIQNPGQMIVCLPHKLVVTIKGEIGTEDPVDAISE